MKNFLVLIMSLFILLLIGCVPEGSKKCKEGQVIVNGSCIAQEQNNIVPVPAVVPTNTTLLGCGEVPHNGTESRIAYLKSTVSSGEACSSVAQTQMRTCNNGNWSAWSGTYTHLSCVAQTSSACGAISSGSYEIRTMYQKATVSEPNNCVSETQSRLCTNGQLGNWSGSYNQPKCVVSRIRYESATIQSGEVCKSQMQSMNCEDGLCGVWAPNDYTNRDCSSSAILSNSTAMDLPRDLEGWTVFAPASDSRILYVSATGNDLTGVIYTATSSIVGNNPFIPSQEVKAFKTYAAAFNHTRSGYADWILMKRGDTFYESIGSKVRSGRSKTQPFLIGAYGNNGLSPLLKVGSLGGIAISATSPSKPSTVQYIAVSGLRFYAHTRNPSDLEYVSGEGKAGLDILAYWPNNVIKNVLVEGCAFLYPNGNIVQAGSGAAAQEIEVRRSVFLNSYSTGSHAQGLYSHDVNQLVLEECIFDHNGWLIQSRGSNVQADGQATMFNHNTYFSSVNNTRLKDNIFMRSSSMQNKFTAEKTASNIVVDNNLYIDGEIGIGIETNYMNNEFRLKNPIIRNNVFTHIGKSKPTNRDLAWGLQLAGWDGGVIHNNLMLNQGLSVSNSYFISIEDQSRDVNIYENIALTHQNTSFAIRIKFDGTTTNYKIQNNYIEMTTINSTLLRASVPIDGFIFSNNTYYGPGSLKFILDPVTMLPSQWQSNHEMGASFSKREFKDPSRSIEKYQASINEVATIDAFIEKARSQDRYNWDPRYTAKPVNRWIKEGFEVK